MAIDLYDYQKKTVLTLKSGNILRGGVGSGKTLTSLHFYLLHYKSLPLYVITTAKKRNSKDWIKEAELCNIKNLTVDSWNNINKYKKVINSFFIFDEQKASGHGTWAKAFIHIAKNNKWLLLSATPGDKWEKYGSVFIANGFYKNRKQFLDEHAIYAPFVNYPKIIRWANERKLVYFRNKIEVRMEDTRKTIRNRHYYICDYDKTLYNVCKENHWNIFEHCPIENASQMTQLCRKVVACNDDRIQKAKEIINEHNKIIVFYNYNYEKDILVDVCKSLNRTYRLYCGEKHEEIPDTDEWVYVVNYYFSEAWNCIETNQMLFYSLNYAYWVMEQCEGRIDRINTKYKDLHYHILLSKSSIDQAIKATISRKERFNEEDWGKQFYERERVSKGFNGSNKSGATRLYNN